MAPVMLSSLTNIGFKGLGSSPFEFSKQHIPTVKMAAAVDQMSTGVLDAIGQVHLDMTEAEIEQMLLENKAHGRGLGNESPFCAVAGPFYTKYKTEYGAPLHSCLCGADVFSHFDTKTGYPPSTGAESVALTMAMCACKDEFSARFPAEKESMDVCRVADACPNVDLVAITTGDFATAPGLCDSTACTDALRDIFDEDTSNTCGWIDACPGLDVDALGAGMIDASSLQVICGTGEGKKSRCLDAFIRTDGCGAACADGLRALCPLLGDCSAAELAGGMQSTTEGLCPADGSKVSQKCATAIIGSGSCNQACEATMVNCVQQGDVTIAR